MSIFKCKMCGGTLEFNQGDTIGICDSCGTKQTLPNTNDDVIANLYNRANNLRLKSEFDRAAQVYEDIVNKDDSQAEAHWGIVLCKYGIEYVDDPSTGKKIPTCHRASYEAIRSDADYLAAIDYSDGEQQAIYEAEARAIDRIQKGILEIAKEEKPFDVFICYKETDENGKRTIDSAIANDIYYQLTQEGFKVFYAAITLEDKLGQDYEPYIFAALNSAKVMLVLGTKPEYFNAVWVKNEWSRYLKLIKDDRSRLLIPCYRDMDAYDLPEEFAHLQAQDMSKIGFINDVVRGINKVVKADEPKISGNETVVAGASNANVAPLLERAYLFLEDGKWQDANIYCEKVLDIDPKNAEAYLGKLMADLQIRNRKDLADCAEPFDNRENYDKVLRFGDEKLENEMRGYITHINERNENARLIGIYNNAVSEMDTATTEPEYKAAAETFKTISSFQDADTLIEQCLEKAEACRKDAIYDIARSQMMKETVSGYESAIEDFSTISGWKDADEQIYACRRTIEEIKAKEEANRLERERKAEEKRIAKARAAKKLKKIVAILTPCIVACIVFAYFLTTVIIPNRQYKEAIGKYGDSLKAASVGETIRFGHYEQDNNSSNGKEEIEWIVLANDGDRLLVISKYSLDCQRYSSSYSSSTWESCSLRTWMNGTFLDAAFDSGEQRLIQDTTVTADKNPSYDTNPGNNTTDKVFLLSYAEANEYFSSDSARQCQGTAYCYAQGAYKVGNDNCWWWLRTPGYDDKFTIIVSNEGSFNSYGDDIRSVNDAVRPAMWIDLSEIGE